MDEQPCHCLLCQVPPAPETWDARDRGIADTIDRFGWNVTGVAAEAVPDWAYSIGIWHTLRGPEVCVFGLPAPTAANIINGVGALLQAGERLHDGQRRSDVLSGYDVVLRMVQPHWYRHFFGAGLDFYQRPPMPMIQLLWPDPEGRFPWQPGVEESFAQSQPLLWLPPDDHPPGHWTTFDPTAGWPFPTSLPYTPVRASPGIAAGTAPIATVHRDPDGQWWFLSPDGHRTTTEEVQLRLIADRHPDTATIADLHPGEHATRSPDGTWSRH